MCNKKDKKNRPPLKPRVGPYKKTTAYTSRPCLEQIITLILMVALIALHAIFNISSLVKINHTILNLMLALHYALLLLIIILYIMITTGDPVDSYLQQPHLALSDNDRKYCTLCRSYTKVRSYHCKRCNRCTEDFDHHCKYLNQCIGGRNYMKFLALLIAFIVFNLNFIGHNIWIFYLTIKEEAVAQASICQWVSIPLFLLSLIFLLSTLSLCCFHFYISLCLDLSTFQFYESSESENNNHNKNKNDNDNEGNGNILESEGGLARDYGALDGNQAKRRYMQMQGK